MTNNIPIFKDNEWFEKLLHPSQENPFWREYLAFFSSLTGGITTNPALMVVPADDHIVHRGDGVFEAMKLSGRKIYLFDQHLDRLLHSAGAIFLKEKWPKDTIREIVLRTVEVANIDEAYVRIYLSRGPGDFSVSPYDSIDPQLYVVVTRYKAPSTEKYNSGLKVGVSTIPPKQKWQARIKSCNYLTNVLMKREAVDGGFDYVVGVDREDNEGQVTESATENLMMVDKEGVLVHPPLEGILKGTTMIRVCELARDNGLRTEVRSFTCSDLMHAKEVMMVGTTLDAIGIVQLDGFPIGDGQVGAVTRRLNDLLKEDQRNNR